MKTNFTQELLVRHLYGETTEAERELIARELVLNESLHTELEELLEAKGLLNGKMKQPSNTSIRIIMEYSDKTEHLQES
ncbi:MAG: hypothetical protein IPP77_15295 [Bacteroidetes bacterium]|nr:hypothetical protein [Bacteroidota bacterium]